MDQINFERFFMYKHRVEYKTEMWEIEGGKWGGGLK